MKKQLLLAATALTAAAVAGGAFADEITSAKVSNVDVTTAPYPVAMETVNISSNRVTTATAGHNAVIVEVQDADGDPTSIQPGASYRFTQSFTGANLAAAITSANRAVLIGGVAVTGDAGACFTITTAAGGTSGANSVTYNVAVAGASAGVDSGATACEDTAFAAISSGDFSFRFDTPFRATSIGTVSTTVTGALSPTNALVAADERATFSLTKTLAAPVNGYAVTITADDTTTQLTLADPTYTIISADDVIGEVGYGPTTLGAAWAEAQANAGYANTALPAVRADLELTAIGGDFEYITPQFDGNDFDIDADDASLATYDNAVGVEDVTLTVTGSPEDPISLSPIGFSISVDPELVNAADDELVTVDGAASGALQSLTLEGSNFFAPWVQSTNANYNTVLRISNADSADTGSLQLSLSSPLNAPTRTTCTVTELPKLASVPGNGELAISSADLTTCFGAFGRGDVTINVLSLDTALSAKLRIVNPGGVVSEQSLGRTSGNP